jgi:hypothetical protein
MLLHEIRNRILLAEKNLEEINPSIKCYIVVSFNQFQFMPGDLTPANSKLLDLLKFPKIFLPGQKIEKLTRLADRIKQLKDAKSDRPEDKEILRDHQADFESGIETLEFHEPQCELRFYSLDMEKIQELKAHPIVKRIGKTDRSAASINVVLG